MVKAIREEKVGEALLRIVPSAGGFAGVVISGKKRIGPFFKEGADELWAQLLHERAKIDPEYHGYNGAIKRFLSIFTDGFADERFIKDERDYKLRARDMLIRAVPLTQKTFEKEHCLAALQVYQKTNLLSRFEKARVGDLLKSPKGTAFLQAAAGFTQGDFAPALSSMRRLMEIHGQMTWPVATYLAFLWDPQRHMILKKEVTVDFAKRVGHPFAFRYSSELAVEVYTSLLDLAGETEMAIGSLQPRDRIDTQSFIYVIGRYTDADAAKVQASQGQRA